MKIKLSKSQWEGIGNKTGWMKKEADLSRKPNPPAAEEKLQQVINAINQIYQQNSKNPAMGIVLRLIQQNHDAIITQLQQYGERLGTEMPKV